MKIFETKNFIVEPHPQPHVTRLDGGHIRIIPKKKYSDRTKLSAKLATELMRLTMVVGEAMKKGMNKRGIDLEIINYQENGNWSVFKKGGIHMHIHLYGRAKSAKINKFGDAIFTGQRSTGFYDNFEPLNKEDVEEIQKQIKIILNKPKYKNWKI